MGFENEAAIIQAALNQDAQAWTELVTLYGGKIYGIALRLLANEKEAEDAVQDIWILISQKLADFRGESKLGTWIYRVASNKCLERLRSRKREKTESIEKYLPQFQEDGHYVKEFADWSENPAEKADENIIKEYLQEAVSKLPAEYREVLVLRDIEGMSGEETSELLGLNESTMKTKLHRARMALREKLERKLGKKKTLFFFRLVMI